jgi:hypothetical protein
MNEKRVKIAIQKECAIVVKFALLFKNMLKVDRIHKGKIKRMSFPTAQQWRGWKLIED